jgi:GT2 family glycosyltransferase
MALAKPTAKGTSKAMKLSIVIICWNDWKVLEDCLDSIFKGTHDCELEVIVSDNGSADGSVEKIRARFPAVLVVENRANLGFAKGNNAGLREARGEFVLILNPDTIVHDGSLDRWIAFADRHLEAGAFGCRVQNPDGTYQVSARPFPTVRRAWLTAMYLRPLAYVSRAFLADVYPGWKGDSEREVDWQSGCCVMFRGGLLRKLGGFDEQFFYQYEEVDLCRRIWDAGYRIRFTPEASITHLGGQSVGRFPIRFAIERCRNGYRYFYKHFGEKGARRCRRVLLMHLGLRQIGYRVISWIRPTTASASRLDMYRVAAKWNKSLDPVEFVRRGTEPPLDEMAPLTTG